MHHMICQNFELIYLDLKQGRNSEHQPKLNIYVIPRLINLLNGNNNSHKEFHS